MRVIFFTRRFLISAITVVVFSILFYVVDVQFKILTFLVFFPLVLGILVQEKHFNKNNTDIVYKIFWTSLLSIFFVPLLVYLNNIIEGLPVGSLHEYYLIIVGSFCGILSIWSVFSHEKKYIYTLSLETFILQCLFFSYWIHGFSSFLIGSVILSILICIFYWKKIQVLELLFSISSSIISLIFWCNYVLFISHSYNFDYILQNLGWNSVYVVGEFILLGMSLGFMLQNIFMLITYLPSKHHFYNREHRNYIRNANKQFLHRFDETLTPFSTVSFLYVFTFGSVIFHFYIPFISIELFVGIMFIIIPFTINYLRNHNKI